MPETSLYWNLHTEICKIPSSTLLTFTIPEIVTTSPGTQLSTEVESESTNVFLTLYIATMHEIVTTSPGTQLSTEVESESTNVFLTLYIVSVKQIP